MPRTTAPVRDPVSPTDEGTGLDRCAALIRAVADTTAAAAQAREAVKASREAFIEAKYVYKCAIQERRESRRREKSTAVAARQACDDCRASLHTAHRAWRAAHPQATAEDHERFCAEIGTQAGVSARQVARLLGYRMPRTNEELWEDYRLHQAGLTEREIARYRGVTPGSVHEALGRCAGIVRGNRNEWATPVEGTHGAPMQNGATPPMRMGGVAGFCTGTG